MEVYTKQEQEELKPTQPTIKPTAAIKAEVQHKLDDLNRIELKNYYELIECAIRDVLLNDTLKQKYLVGREVWIDGQTNEVLLRRDYKHYVSASERLRVDPDLECIDDSFTALNGSVLPICRVRVR